MTKIFLKHFLNEPKQVIETESVLSSVFYINLLIKTMINTDNKIAFYT